MDVAAVVTQKVGCSVCVARHLRVECPGAVYHVMARGDDRTKISRNASKDRRMQGELLTAKGTWIRSIET